MEISGKKPHLNINAYVQNARIEKTGAKTGKGAGFAGQEDRVDISGLAHQVREAAKSLEEMPEVRQDKVADIKARIQNGTYEIDGDKIALKIIRDSLINDLA